MERLPYQPPFLAVRDPEVNRALYEMYLAIATAVNQIGESTEQLRRTSSQTVAAVGEPFAGVGVQKSGVLVGTEPGFNVVPGANVGITAADNPGAKRVDLTFAAIPGGTIPPYTSLWKWNGTDFTQFSIAYTGAGGPGVVGDVTQLVTADADSGDAAHDHISHMKFFNPVGSAVNVFFLYSSISLAPATGELLCLQVDFANAGAANTVGIIIAKAGSEATDNYRVLDNNAANIDIYKAVSGVGELRQCGGGAAPGCVSGHWWHKVKMVANLSTGTIGGIPAGGMNVYLGGVPLFKKPMLLGSATVLSGAVTVGFRFAGAAGLAANVARVSRAAAYSVAADFEQFF